MALNQNQFRMATVKGSKDSSMGSVLTAELYDASASTAFVAGEMVAISSTTAPSVTKVAKGADAAGAFFGVILTNPLKETFYTGDRVEIGIIGSIVLMEASAAITAGAALNYTPATKKVVTHSSTNTKIGIALENAAADGSLLRVLIMAQAM
jgi:hypothetical protein